MPKSAHRGFFAPTAVASGSKTHGAIKSRRLVLSIPAIDISPISSAPKRKNRLADLGAHATTNVIQARIDSVAGMLSQ